MKKIIQNIKKTKFTFKTRGVLYLIIIIVGILSIYYCIIFGKTIYSSYHTNSNLTELSNVGQFLSGTIGILITLLVGLIVLAAFFEQRHQINLSERNNYIQSFDNIFFQFVNSYEKMINEIDISEEHRGDRNFDKEFYIGRKIFKRLFEILSYNYHTNSLEPKFFFGNDITDPVSDNKKQKINELINNSYLLLDKKYQPYIGYYFRHIYYIINLIDKSQVLTIDEKQSYINILRAKISGYELLLLFYNCLSTRGSEKFKPLIEKYHFLKHINVIESLLIDKSNVDHKSLYNTSAFNDN